MLTQRWYGQLPTMLVQYQRTDLIRPVLFLIKKLQVRTFMRASDITSSSTTAAADASGWINNGQAEVAKSCVYTSMSIQIHHIHFSFQTCTRHESSTEVSLHTSRHHVHRPQPCPVRNKSITWNNACRSVQHSGPSFRVAHGHKLPEANTQRWPGFGEGEPAPSLKWYCVF